MLRLQYRGSMILAAAGLALLGSAAADAQDLVLPGIRRPINPTGPLVTADPVDALNKAQAEHQLQKLEAKYRSDAERCDADAMGRDARRIEYLRYRIAVDVWLIRKFAQQDPGCYPHVVDEDSLAYIAQAGRTGPEPACPQYRSYPVSTTPAPTITVTLVNAEPAKAGVAFAIDGVAHQASGGSRQDLAVSRGSTITYDGGGSIGRRQYGLSPGVYEFRPTAEGLAFYKQTVSR